MMWDKTPEQIQREKEWDLAHKYYMTAIGLPESHTQTWPHCDPLILHRPKSCVICDEYAADLQVRREAAGMNFTNEADETKLTDPAVMMRKSENLNAWHGNVPQKENEDAG